MRTFRNSGRVGALGRAVQIVTLLIAAVLLAIVVTTPLELGQQAMLGGALFVLGLILTRFRSHAATLVLVFLSVVVSARYIFWRVTVTVDPGWSLDAVLAMGLLAAELYVFGTMLLGNFQTLAPLKRKPVPVPGPVRDWPSVDVFIPTYDEPLSVIRTTVLAAKCLDWPSDKLNIYILDDGHRDEFRAFAARAGVGYLDRGENSHAKAGNLNAALAKTSGELVAVFDCDHVPTRSFLQMTVGWFCRDPKVSLVQTPHCFYSPDPFERNLDTFGQHPNEGRLFYGLIQPGNDLWNAAFFCGSCAVLRRAALEEIGGFAVETLTEDAHTSIKMTRAGWSSAFLDLPQAAGLAAESLAAHVRQRIRWARGMAQIFRVDNPLLGRGLSASQRLCFLSAMLHFFHGLPRLVFLLAPLAFLVFGAHIFNARPLMVVAYAAPHILVATLTTSSLHGSFRRSFWGEVYEAALAAYIVVPTTLALFNPRLGGFDVTAKGGLIEKPHLNLSLAVPYFALIGANLLGLGLGLFHLFGRQVDVDVVAINVVWTIYNLAILGAVMAVAFERRQVRRAQRMPVKIPAMLRLPSDYALSCRTNDISVMGASVACATAPELEPGEDVFLSLYVRGEEQALPARVVAAERDRGRGVVRVEFHDLTLEQELWVGRATFSRADAWCALPGADHRDRPLWSLLGVAGHALRGVRRAVSEAMRTRTAPARVP